jgi:hypothetical protein
MSIEKLQPALSGRPPERPAGRRTGAPAKCGEAPAILCCALRSPECEQPALVDLTALIENEQVHGQSLRLATAGDEGLLAASRRTGSKKGIAPCSDGIRNPGGPSGSPVRDFSLFADFPLSDPLVRPLPISYVGNAPSTKRD